MLDALMIGGLVSHCPSLEGAIASFGCSASFDRRREGIWPGSARRVVAGERQSRSLVSRVITYRYNVTNPMSRLVIRQSERFVRRTRIDANLF
eukprot:5439668-Prymnesium_polylepis.1